MPPRQRFTRPRDILLAVGLFGSILGALLFAGVFAVYAVNGARAYVAGLGYWSEAINHAVFHLDHYAERGDPENLDQFRRAIGHPLAFMRARQEIETEDPDTEAVRRELIAGGIHPADVDGVVRVFRHLGDAGPFREAVEIWRASDADVLALVELAERMEPSVGSEGALADGTEAMRAELAAIRERLRDHGIAFAEAISAGARWAARLGTAVMAGTALLLFFVGAPILIVTLRRIRRADAALFETEERFRQITENIDEVFWIAEPDLSRYHYLSPAFEQIWGMSREDAHSNPPSVLDRIHPDDAERVRSEFLQSRTTSEYRIIHPDGAVRWLSSRTVPIRDARGRTFRFAGITADVTPRKEAEASRRRAEERYRMLVESSPYSIFFIDTDGHMVEINRAGTEILGRTSDELLGMSFQPLVAPEALDRGEAVFARLMSGEADHGEIELPIVRPSGERRILDAVVLADREEDSVSGVWGIARDVTELREQERRSRLLSTALSSLRDEGVAIIRADGSYVFTNEAHARIYGYEPGQPPSAGTFAIAPTPELREETDRVFEICREQGGWSGRIWRRRLDDGRMIPLDVILAPMHEMPEDLFISIVRDASEEVNRERELRRAERLSGLARLVGGVAHELNNPLTSIKGFVELVMADERFQEARTDLEVIRREADRAAKIVQDLRLIAGKGRPQTGIRRGVADLREVILHVARVRAYAAASEGFELETRLPDRPVWVEADTGELEQIVLNLVQNAEDAVAESAGERRVEMGCTVVDDRAHVTVRDTGDGITEDLQERLFDPFWTTKDEGTGLGLPIVQGIVKDLGGSVEVESRSGGPTVFTVALPLARDERAEAKPSGVSRGEGPLRILIVDDESPIRTSLRRHFEGRGHRVEEAADGAEALRRIDAAEALFDVVLTDLRMPGFGGKKLYDHLAEHHPALAGRVIFMTGDAVSERAVRLLEDVPVPVVLKPFEMDEISELVERLGAPSGA